MFSHFFSSFFNNSAQAITSNPFGFLQNPFLYPYLFGFVHTFLAEPLKNLDHLQKSWWWTKDSRGQGAKDSSEKLNNYRELTVFKSVLNFWI